MNNTYEETVITADAYHGTYDRVWTKKSDG